MYYECNTGYFRLIMLVLDDDQDITCISTECGVTISPVAKAEVILHISIDDHKVRLVYDGFYGALPSGALVLAIKDAEDTIPKDDELTLRVIFDPYTLGDEPWVEWAVVKAMTDVCPVCGNAGPPEPEPEPEPEPDTESEDEPPEPFNRCDFFFNSDN